MEAKHPLSEAAEGAANCLPLALAAFFLAMVFGTLADQSGLSILETGLMSLLVFAGASQFVALELWDSPLPVLLIVLTTLAVNARHFLMGFTIAPLFAGTSATRAYPAMFLMTDEIWGLTLKRMREGQCGAGFFVGAGLCFYTLWVTGSLLGRLISGAVVNPSGFALDFLGTAFFLALLMAFWRRPADLLPWGVAAAASLASLQLLPSGWHILIGAIAGAVAGALRHDD